MTVFGEERDGLSEAMKSQESGWNGELLQAGGGLMQVKSTVKIEYGADPTS